MSRPRQRGRQPRGQTAGLRAPRSPPLSQASPRLSHSSTMQPLHRAHHPTYLCKTASDAAFLSPTQISTRRRSLCRCAGLSPPLRRHLPARSKRHGHGGCRRRGSRAGRVSACPCCCPCRVCPACSLLDHPTLAATFRSEVMEAEDIQPIELLQRFGISAGEPAARTGWLCCRVQLSGAASARASLNPSCAKPDHPRHARSRHQEGQGGRRPHGVRTADQRQKGEAMWVGRRLTALVPSCVPLARRPAPPTAVSD